MDTHPMRRTRVVISCSLLLLVLALAVSHRARGAQGDFAWVEVWRHTVSTPLEYSAAAWPPDGGPALLAAVGGGRVALYALFEEGPRFVAGIDGLGERPTAAHVRAEVEPGVDEVWIGTESPGIVYIYRLVRSTGRVELRERIGFAWGDIVQVIPVDLDGWGEQDVAVRTREGSLALFRWTPAGYRDVSLGSLGREVRSLANGRILAGVGENLVLARGNDHVVVLRWELSQAAHEARRAHEAFRQAVEEWELLPPERRPSALIAPPPAGDGGDGAMVVAWENYIWGSHAGLFVGPFAGGQQELIALLSTQDLFYLYGTDAERGRITQLRPPVSWPAPFARLIGTGALGGSARAELIQATDAGIQGWLVDPRVAVSRALATAMRPVDAAHFGNDELVIAGSWGFALLRKRDPNFVRVLHHGQEVQPDHPVLARDGSLYFSAADWRRFSRALIRFDPRTGKITGLRGFRFFAGELGEATWIVDGRAVTLDAPALLHDGRLYLPVDFGRAVGIRLEWDPYSHTLVFN